jgi:hypothetical protein
VQNPPFLQETPHETEQSEEPYDGLQRHNPSFVQTPLELQLLGQFSSSRNIDHCFPRFVQMAKIAFEEGEKTKTESK